MAPQTGAAFADTSARSATIDYRLRRRRLLNDIRAGVVSATDACDAHPELLRVARNAAAPLDEPCPICDDGELRMVGYVFGPRLGGGGKCVVSDAELARLAQRRGSFQTYEMEVCPDCGWNHLLRRYRIGADAD
ncbi:MAG TPA: hypothetical protein DEP66_00455 [Acidimicrobiaceae bacterium]|nr:hypothetical protein [Acidimicrobiaceae bacterium]HCB36717.1 hypothetical protein [Acidimicrobiaceae bacterium]